MGTVNYIRLAVLMVGEVVKELYQAERQRGWAVEPRMHRDLHFAVERAVTNIALRTVSTALVIEEMYGGAPTIYVDYTGYDAIAHHCGPERVESIDALEGIDRAIGSLRKAARHTPRPYRMVVLSDHGQCLGATFSQRFGESSRRSSPGSCPARRPSWARRTRSNRPGSAAAWWPSCAADPAPGAAAAPPVPH